MQQCGLCNIFVYPAQVATQHTDKAQACAQPHITDSELTTTASQKRSSIHMHAGLHPEYAIAHTHKCDLKRARTQHKMLGGATESKPLQTAVYMRAYINL